MTFSIPALAAGVAHLVHLHAAEPSIPRSWRVALGGLAAALIEAADEADGETAIKLCRSISGLLPNGKTRDAVQELAGMLLIVAGAIGIDEHAPTEVASFHAHVVRCAARVERCLDGDAIEVCREVDTPDTAVAS